MATIKNGDAASSGAGSADLNESIASRLLNRSAVDQSGFPAGNVSVPLNVTSDKDVVKHPRTSQGGGGR